MIKIGHYNTLRILRETSVGLFLGDESGEDVLLPNKYVPEEFEIDDMLKVFVYLDYDERKVATNLTPKIFMNEFALLQVAAVSEVGAFMEWGLEKHLLVPFKEQRQKMEEGRWYVIYMDLDTSTERLYGSNKIEKRLDNSNLQLKEDEEVEVLVYRKTDIGYSVIINNLYKGLIYENEIFTDLNIGDKKTGWVKKIREENKVDISLTPIGYDKAISRQSEDVYNLLKDNNGFLALNDKSKPEEIYETFSMSKKAFKKAIGDLYKQRKISISEEGIKILE